MDDWTENTEPISVEVLKKEIEEMRMAYDIYSEAKEVATEAHQKFKEKEARVIAALEQGGLKNLAVPGLGTASIRRTYKVTTPKSLEQKRELFSYVQEKYGEDFLDSFRSINSQSLNKFYNEEKKAAIEEGHDVHVPGLDDPTEHVSISFRKETV